ncbi:hypothetical protein D4R52_03440 [bacterium]|nr:MAG: hypothetical protein D4R52_03440 [bacterium]
MNGADYSFVYGIAIMFGFAVYFIWLYWDRYLSYWLHRLMKACDRLARGWRHTFGRSGHFQALFVLFQGGGAFSFVNCTRS